MEVQVTRKIYTCELHVYRWWIMTARIASKLPGFANPQTNQVCRNQYLTKPALNRTLIRQCFLSFLGFCLGFRPMTRIAIWWPLIPVGPSCCKAWSSVFPACKQHFRSPSIDSMTNCRLTESSLKFHETFVHPGPGIIKHCRLVEIRSEAFIRVAHSNLSHRQKWPVP
jgi:hypothetical protein